MIGSETVGNTGSEALPGEQLWPMGAVTRRTGIGEHTLRAWERRYGFPQPFRLPSGHRRYTGDQVRQLLLIGEALRRGYRAGDVVTLDQSRLEALLQDSGAAVSVVEQSPDWLQQILEASRRFDRDEVFSRLRHAAANLGTGVFLRERVTPLLHELGEAWSRGELEIRHEHFCSEVLEDVLRTLRLPLEATATGRPVVLTSLPDESHGLGLHIVALAVAAAGRSPRVLGTYTPANEIIQTALSVDAAAVGVSITDHTVGDESVQQVTNIRRELPSRIRLWLGGAGAKRLTGLPFSAEVLDTLDDLDRALQLLSD
jgi:DNA-binding transcriptional MerR regulator/methylmalonyl-CoA mutase cobalamin-binding subunit